MRNEKCDIFGGKKEKFIPFFCWELDEKITLMSVNMMLELAFD